MALPIETTDSTTTSNIVRINYERSTKPKPSQIRPLTSNQSIEQETCDNNNYNSSLRLCQELAQSICRGNMDEYTERIDILKMLTSIWNDGLKVELKPISQYSSERVSADTSLDISTMHKTLCTSISEEPVERQEADTEPLIVLEETQKIDNGLPKESTLHKDIIRRGRPKNAKASQNTLVSTRPAKKAKIETTSLLISYLNEVTTKSFDSISTTSSQFIDEDIIKVRPFSHQAYSLDLKLTSQGVDFREYFTNDALILLENNYNLSETNSICHKCSNLTILDNCLCCEKCFKCYHLECYKRKFMPKKAWYCSSCKI